MKNFTTTSFLSGFRWRSDSGGGKPRRFSPCLLRLTLIMVILLGMSNFGWAQLQTFSTSGTFVVPAGATSITIAAWGGGGNGGNTSNAGSFLSARAGAGGGGGAYASTTYSVIPGEQYTVTVAAAGGTSTVTGPLPGTTVLVKAVGGSNGTSNTSGTGPWLGGQGGAAASCIGTISVSGEDGGTGASNYNDGVGIAWTGAGGAGGYIGGAGGASFDGIGTTANGNPGTAPGGGGSGSRTSYGDNIPRTGGAGGSGLVTFSWGCPNAIISYAGTPYCQSLTTPQAVSFTGSAGGTFSYTGTGTLTIDPSTGAITPSTSTVGTYTVHYIIPADPAYPTSGCAGVDATASVTINAVTATPSITAAPSICAGATLINGTCNDVDGTVVEVFVGAVSAGTTTVTSHAWTKSVPTLAVGDVLTARATTSGKCVSATSDLVVISATAAPVIDAPICAASTSVSGTCEANAVVNVYIGGSTSLGTAVTTGTTWTLTGLTPFVYNSVITATAQVSGQCLSAISAPVTVIPVTAKPVITTARICAGTNSISGTSGESFSVITIYAGSTPIGTATANSVNVWTATVSPEFVAGDIITATSTHAGYCVSGTSTNSVTVSDPTPKPVITTAPICAGTNIVSGTSTAADGTTIEVFAGTVSLGTTTVASGLWTKTVSPAFAAEAVITAKSYDLAGGCGSLASDPVAVLPLTAQPVITTTQVCGGTNTISGTSESFAEIFVYAGAIHVGTTTANDATHWTFTYPTPPPPAGLGSLSGFVAGDVITVTAQLPGKCVSIASAPVTVTPDPMISFGFNGVEANHNASFAYCYNEPITVSLYHIYQGTGPFSVTYTLDGTPATVTGLNVNSIIAGPQTLSVGPHAIAVTDITDATGCHATEAFLSYCTAAITINAEPMISFGFNGEEAGHNASFTYCYDVPVGVTLHTIYGGTAPYSVTYTLDGGTPVVVADLNVGSTIASPQLLAAGEHHIAVTDITDANGCKASADFLAYCTATVTINSEPMISFGFNGAEANHNASFAYCYDVPVGVTLHTVYGGTAPYSVTYKINDETPVTVTGLGVGGTIVASQIYTAGVYNVEVTNITDAKGCQASQAFLAFCKATITINPAPAIDLAVGGATMICPTTSTDITVAQSVIGTSYQLRTEPGDANVGTPVIGTGSTINLPTGPLAGTPTAPTIYTFNVYATTTPGCSAELTQKVDVTVYEYPKLDLTVGGSGPVCIGTGTDITVANTEVGVTYQLRVGPDHVGTQVPGTGGTINLPTGPLTVPTTFNVYANIFPCTAHQLIESATVTINPSPMISFGFNDVEAGHNASFTYCYDQPITVDLFHNYQGTAPFSVTYTLDGVPVGPVTGLTVGDVLAGPQTLGVGEHNIVVTDIVDGNGCHASAEFLAFCKAAIHINSEPMISFGFNGVEADHNASFTYCYDQPITVNLFHNYQGTAPFSVTYTLDGGSAVTVNNKNIGDVIAGPQTLAIGEHHIAVTNITDANGCQAGELFLSYCTATIYINTDPQISFGFNGVEAGHGATFTYCFDQQIEVSLYHNYLGTAPFSVTYTLDGGTPVTVNNKNVGDVIAGPQLLVAGPHTIVVTDITDALGCHASPAFLAYCHATVNINPSPDITLAVAGTNAICAINTGADVTVALSQPGVKYQLRTEPGDVAVGSEVTGTGGTINLPTGTLAAALTDIPLYYTFNVYATTPEGCSNELTEQATITVCNYPDKTLAVGGGTSGCSGTNTNITVGDVLKPSQIGVFYQLRNDATNTNIGSPVAGNGGTVNLPTGSITGTTTFNVWAYMVYCSGKELDQMATVTIVAPPTLTSVTPSMVSACATDQVSFTATGLIPSVSTIFTYTATPGGTGSATVMSGSDGTYTFPATTYLPGAYNIVINTVTVNGCTKVFDMGTNFTVKDIPTLGSVTPSMLLACVSDNISFTATGLLPGVSTTFAYTVNATPGSATAVTSAEGTYTFPEATYPVGTYDIEITSVTVDGCTTDLTGKIFSFTVNALPEVSDVTLQATVDAPVAATPWTVGGTFPSFNMCIDPLVAYPSYFNLDINTLTSSVALATGFKNGFTLDQTNLPTNWLAYWAAKGVVSGATGWQGVMWDIINGDAPIFYINYTGTDYQMIDGMTWQVAATEVPLRVSGDYPEWNYMFTGTVKDVNGCVSSAFNVNMEFNTVPVPTISGDDPVYANSVETYTTEAGMNDYDWNVTGGTITSGGTTSDNTATITWGAGPDGSVSVNYTDPDGTCTASTATVKDITIESNLSLNVRVFLEGAYLASTGEMITALNTGGYLPHAQPYNVAPWNYTGSETVTTIPADVVDWVLVELRDAPTPAEAIPATKLAGWPRAFFLKADGSIVNLDGVTKPNIGNPTVANNLYVVIRHRNHLAIMSAEGATFDAGTGVYSFDFTTGLGQAYGGGNGYKPVASVFAMVAGDIDHDGSVFVSDYNLWAAEYGLIGNYFKSDLDMEGRVFVSDYNFWAANFGKLFDSGLKSASLKPMYFSSVPK